MKVLWILRGLFLAVGVGQLGREARAEDRDEAVARRVESVLKTLESTCVRFQTSGWWSYEWCHKVGVRQFHTDKNGKVVTDWSAGKVLLKQVGRVVGKGDLLQYEFVKGQKCDETGTGRATEVRIKCCSGKRLSEAELLELPIPQLAKIISLEEISTCRYLMTVCSPAMCWGQDLWKAMSLSKVGEHADGVVDDTKWTIRAESNDEDVREESVDEEEQDRILSLSRAEQQEMLEMVKNAFYRGYNAYMTFAFPQDELKPLSCSGEDFELTAGNMLTLIDSLDMLAVVGNRSEFAKAVKIVESRANFDLDQTVSVFETTIRILGGLLSAHLIAADKSLGFMDDYDGGLLPIAVDLADRLLPAFNTTTSIPYGTVNLRHGVPPKETTEACTAAAGSLSLEFGTLSVLTGDPRYGRAARDALRAIFDHRSKLGLVGRHIDIMSGKWTEPTAGIGSNIDSLYEYYLKHYILFGDEDAFDMFQELYGAAIEHLRIENVFYVEVNVHRGGIQRRQFNNLQAFWPGMQTLLGDLEASTKTINAFLRVWNEFGFTPEDFNIDKWVPLSGGTRRGYPLRPELAESVYYTMLATDEPSWLVAGRDMMLSLEETCRVECGYASVMDIKTERLHDTMPSFFLSELLKYLYLLFDAENPFREDRGGNYVFTTEAHPLPVRSDFQKAAQEMGFAFPSTRKISAIRAQANAEFLASSRTPTNFRQQQQGVKSTQGKGKVEEKPRDDYSNKVRHLWGVRSIGPEMTAFRQCPALELSTWDKEDPSIEMYYASHLDLRTPRRSGFEPTNRHQKPKQSPRQTEPQQRSPSFQETTQEELIQEVESGTPFKLSGLRGAGTVVGKTVDYGFVLEHSETGAVLEINSMSGDVLCARLATDTSKESIPNYVFLKPNEQFPSIKCNFQVRPLIPSPDQSTCTSFGHKQVFTLLQQNQQQSFTSLSFPLFQKRPCALSDFAPPGFKPGSLQGELVLAKTKTGCSTAAYSRTEVSGKWVLVLRGECMFEQKARFAQLQGASGLVVVQNVPNQPIFYMAGVNAGESMGPLFDSLRNSVPAIPTFMVEYKDGMAMYKALESGKATIPLSIKVDVEEVRADGTEFPWGEVQKNGVKFFASTSWGIHLLEEGSGRWTINLVVPPKPPHPK